MAQARKQVHHAAHPQVEMRIYNLSVQGATHVQFDLEVRPGTMTHMSIEHPTVESFPYAEKTFCGPNTHYMRGVRVSTDRPQVVFKHLGTVAAVAHLNLSSGWPRVMDSQATGVTMR